MQCQSVITTKQNYTQRCCTEEIKIADAGVNRIHTLLGEWNSGSDAGHGGHLLECCCVGVDQVLVGVLDLGFPSLHGLQEAVVQEHVLGLTQGAGFSVKGVLQRFVLSFV